MNMLCYFNQQNMTCAYFLKWFRTDQQFYSWKSDHFQQETIPYGWIFMVVLLALLTQQYYIELVYPAIQIIVILGPMIPVVWIGRAFSLPLVKRSLLVVFALVTQLQTEGQGLYCVAIKTLMLQEIYRSIPVWKVRISILLVEAIIPIVINQDYQILAITITHLVLLVYYENRAKLVFSMEQQMSSIINSMHNAVCIIKNNNELIYSNEAYRKLAVNLNNQLKGSEPSDTQSIIYAQLQLLQNLQFDEITNRGSVQSNIVDESYRISKVSFGDSTRQPQHDNLEEIYTDQQLCHFVESSYFHNQIFGVPIEHRKQYSADIEIQLELDHQPSSYVQSAVRRKMKQHLKQTTTIAMQGPSTPTPLQKFKRRRYFSESPELNRLNISEERKDTGPSIISQRVRLLVSQVKSYPSITNDEYRVYVMQDLSQALTQEKLDEMDRVKKNLFRSISHDLVTYLNGAYGYLQEYRTHLRQTSCCQQQKKLLDAAYKCIKLQIYKTYDFSDFRDIINEQFNLRMERVNLNMIIDECVELVEDQAKNKQLSIKVEGLSQPTYVYVDRRRLCQVLLNLLSNAIRFTEKGGVNISFKQVPKHQAQSNPDLDQELSISRMLDKVLEIRVTDSGIGLEQDKLGILAKKLQLVDEYEKVSKDSVGIGMGLAVCKHILQRIGPKELNQLCVSSQPDVGTQFSFYLESIEKQHRLSPFQAFLPVPETVDLCELNLENAAPIRVSFYNRSHRGSLPESLYDSRCRCQDILLVDDEHFNIEALTFITKRFGFDTHVAYNGKEALSKFQSRMDSKCRKECAIFKVILMDINMPIMSGWDAARQMRILEEKLQLPRQTIIAVTGFCSSDDKQKCIDSGFDHVMEKPVTATKLIQTLEWFQIVSQQAQTNPNIINL